MDPTGGMGLWILLGCVVITIAAFFILPHIWAVALAIALGIGFVALIVYVLNNTRFT